MEKIMYKTVSNFTATKYRTIFKFSPDVHDTVSNFAAAKYGTVSIFVMTRQNDVKFCSHKIWDHFNFLPDVCKTVSNFAPAEVIKTALNFVAAKYGKKLILLTLLEVPYQMK